MFGRIYSAACQFSIQVQILCFMFWLDILKCCDPRADEEIIVAGCRCPLRGSFVGDTRGASP